MCVYIYQAHVDVCVSNICAPSPHSRWGFERRWSCAFLSPAAPTERAGGRPASARARARASLATHPDLPLPPDPPSWDQHPAQPGCVTAVPPNAVWGAGTLLRSRLSGFGLCWEEPCAGACSRLPVLHCDSFISSCVLINQLGPLPAGSNPGWVVGEAPWEWEGACGKHSCAPRTHRNLSQSPWGLCYARFWGKITQGRGFWVYLSPWGEIWLQGVPRPAGHSALQGEKAVQGAAPTLQPHSRSRCCLTLFLSLERSPCLPALPFCQCEYLHQTPSTALVLRCRSCYHGWSQ